MPADSAGVRDGACGGGHIACGAARRDEGERNGNSEIALPARRTGVSTGGIDAYSLQGSGKRSVEVPRFGGSAAEARGGGKRPAAKQRCGGRGQSRVGRKPPAAQGGSTGAGEP